MMPRAQAIAVFDPSPQNVGNGLDAAMRMPGNPAM
jgi:hypothetical protein